MKIMRAEKDDPIKQISADYKNLRLNDYGTIRVGRPRINWWTEGINNYWEYLTLDVFSHFRGERFNHENRGHIIAIELSATMFWGTEEGEREGSWEIIDEETDNR